MEETEQTDPEFEFTEEQAEQIAELFEQRREKIRFVESGMGELATNFTETFGEFDPVYFGTTEQVGQRLEAIENASGGAPLNGLPQRTFQISPPVTSHVPPKVSIGQNAPWNQAPLFGNQVVDFNSGVVQIRASADHYISHNTLNSKDKATVVYNFPLVIIHSIGPAKHPAYEAELVFDYELETKLSWDCDPNSPYWSTTGGWHIEALVWYPGAIGNWPMWFNGPKGIPSAKANLNAHQGSVQSPGKGPYRTSFKEVLYFNHVQVVAFSLSVDVEVVEGSASHELSFKLL